MVIIEAHFSSGGNIPTEISNIRHLFPKRFETRVQQQTKAHFTVTFHPLADQVEVAAINSSRSPPAVPAQEENVIVQCCFAVVVV